MKRRRLPKAAKAKLEGAIKARLVLPKDRAALTELIFELSEKPDARSAQSAITRFLSVREADPSFIDETDSYCEAKWVCRDRQTGHVESWQPIQAEALQESFCPPPVEVIADMVEPEQFELDALDGFKGAATELFYPTASGQSSLSAFYALIGSSQLITSHDAFDFSRKPEELYPRILQERDYARDELEQRKVRENSRPGRFEPAFLVAETPTAIDGPPVIDTQGRVLGGNSRAMVIARIMKNPELREAYNRAIEAEAPCFGLEGVYDTDGMVLVRVVPSLGGLRVEAVSRALNRPFTQHLSEEAAAPSYGRMLSRGLLRAIAEFPDKSLAQKLLIASVGERVVDELYTSGIITPQTESEWLVKRRGSTEKVLSKRGREKLTSAVMGALVDDPETLALMPKGYRKLLERLAPYVLQLSELPKGGGDWNFIEAFKTATSDLHITAGKKKRELANYLLNQSIFGSGLAVFEAETFQPARLWLWMYNHRAGKVATEGVNLMRRYVELAVVQTEQQSSMFGSPGAKISARDGQAALGLRAVGKLEATPQLYLYRGIIKAKIEEPHRNPFGPWRSAEPKRAEPVAIETLRARGGRATQPSIFEEDLTIGRGGRIVFEAADAIPSVPLDVQEDVIEITASDKACGVLGSGLCDRAKRLGWEAEWGADVPKGLFSIRKRRELIEAGVGFVFASEGETEMLATRAHYIANEKIMTEYDAEDHPGAWSDERKNAWEENTDLHNDLWKKLNEHTLTDSEIPGERAFASLVMRMATDISPLRDGAYFRPSFRRLLTAREKGYIGLEVEDAEEIALWRKSIQGIITKWEWSTSGNPYLRHDGEMSLPFGVGDGAEFIKRGTWHAQPSGKGVYSISLTFEEPLYTAAKRIFPEPRSRKDTRKIKGGLISIREIPNPLQRVLEQLNELGAAGKRPALKIGDNDLVYWARNIDPSRMTTSTFTRAGRGEIMIELPTGQNLLFVRRKGAGMLELISDSEKLSPYTDKKPKKPKQKPEPTSQATPSYDDADDTKVIFPWDLEPDAQEEPQPELDLSEYKVGKTVSLTFAEKGARAWMKKSPTVDYIIMEGPKYSHDKKRATIEVNPGEDAPKKAMPGQLNFRPFGEFADTPLAHMLTVYNKKGSPVTGHPIDIALEESVSFDGWGAPKTQTIEVFTPTSSPSDYSASEVALGLKTELEHTPNPADAMAIVLHHLEEDSNYYTAMAFTPGSMEAHP